MKRGVREKHGKAAKMSKGTALRPVAKIAKGDVTDALKGGNTKAAGNVHKKAGDVQRNGRASESHGAQKKRPGVLEQVSSSCLVLHERFFRTVHRQGVVVTCLLEPCCYLAMIPADASSACWRSIPVVERGSLHI